MVLKKQSFMILLSVLKFNLLTLLVKLIHLPQTVERAMIEIRYEGYIRRQEQQISKLMKYDSISLSSDINYDDIPARSVGLS